MWAMPTHLGAALYGEHTVHDLRSSPPWRRQAGTRYDDVDFRGATSVYAVAESWDGS